jgi:hypothetical protein
MDLNNVDYHTLVVDGVDFSDSPDFCDAFFTSGYDLEGNPLSDETLEHLTENGELLYEHILASVY